MLRTMIAVCFSLFLFMGFVCFAATEGDWNPQARYVDPGCAITSSHCGWVWRTQFPDVYASASVEAERYGYVPQTGGTIPLPLSVTAHAEVLCYEHEPWGGYYGCQKTRTQSGMGFASAQATCNVEHDYDQEDICSCSGCYNSCSDS